MNEKKLMQIYIRVPSRIFTEMQKYGLLNESLDVWFVSMVLEEIDSRKNEIENGQLNR